jgi:hypothetical protein
LRESIRVRLSNSLAGGDDERVYTTKAQMATAINAVPWRFLRRGIRLSHDRSGANDLLWLLVGGDVPAALLKSIRFHQLSAAVDIDLELRMTPLKVVRGRWDLRSAQLAERFLSSRMYILIRSLGYRLDYKSKKTRHRSMRANDAWADRLMEAIGDWDGAL